MAFTFLPIDSHGDLLELELDQHPALLPVSGIRNMIGDFNVGHNDILDCNDMDIEGDLTVLGVIDGFTMGGDIDMGGFDILDCNTLVVDIIEGLSPVHIRTQADFGQNDEGSIGLTEVVIAGEPEDALGLILNDENLVLAMLSPTWIALQAGEGISLIAEEDIISVSAIEISFETPDADGVNFHMDNQGAHWLDQLGQLDPLVFDIFNSDGVPGFSFDHNANSLTISGDVGFNNSQEAAGLTFVRDTSSTSIYGGRITLDVVTQSAEFPEGRIDFIGYTKVTGELFVSDKVSYFRTNGTTSISGSIADGYMDYLAQFQHRFDTDMLIEGKVDVLDLISSYNGAVIGDGGISDYVEIAGDGFITLVGDARVKNHVSVFATGAGPGINTPTLTTRAIGGSGGVEVDVLRFSDILQNDSRIGFCGPPSIDDSANGHFVLKWIPGVTYNNSGFYRWVVEYLVKDADGDVTTGTPTTISVDVTPSNNTDRIETVFPASVDLNGGQRVSAHFYRDAASDTANGGGGDVEEWQFEYTQNKIGQQAA